jgi:hypothetical protein
VYTADEVVQQWCVPYRGKIVKGPTGNGHVALVGEGDVLKIYVASEGGQDQSVMDIVDEVFKFCGMQAQNPEHCELCLHIAISEANEARVSKIFTDKGIPTLEGLKFADVDENNPEDNPDEDKKGPSSAILSSGQDTTSDAPKKGLRSSRALQVAGAIIGFPVVVAVAVRGFAADTRYFDDEDNRGDGCRKVKVETVKSPKPKKPKKPKVVKPKGEPNESNGFQKSVSKCWVRIQEMACSDEDIAAVGEICVSYHLNAGNMSGDQAKQTDHSNYRCTKYWQTHLAKITTSNIIGLANFVQEPTSQYSTPTETRLLPHSNLRTQVRLSPSFLPRSTFPARKTG